MEVMDNMVEMEMMEHQLLMEKTLKITLKTLKKKGKQERVKSGRILHVSIEERRDQRDRKEVMVEMLVEVE